MPRVCCKDEKSWVKLKVIKQSVAEIDLNSATAFTVTTRPLFFILWALINFWITFFLFNKTKTKKEKKKKEFLLVYLLVV